MSALGDLRDELADAVGDDTMTRYSNLLREMIQCDVDATLEAMLAQIPECGPAHIALLWAQDRVRQVVGPVEDDL